MSEKVDAYTINDIAQWQIELEEAKANVHIKTPTQIALPTLQRGFVWRPHQMEALWDSILRGYPIGSLLMSRTEGGSKQLLDGQQRCTTIALGFQDPLINANESLLNIKQENIPSIWVDLKPINKNKNGLRFAIRVLTRSHPWGYSLSNHAQRLSMADQRNALNSLRKQHNNESLSFSKIEQKQRIPWDAHFPIPLSFLLTTEKDKLKSKIIKELKSLETKYGECDYEKVDESWLNEIYKGVDYAKALLLPEIVVEKDSIEAEDNQEKDNKEQDATLFLRLNSSGTQISGQELIYSLLKASFPEAKELVEEIGLNYLHPNVVVNLFVRFTKMERNDFNSFEKTVSLENFRTLLKEDGFTDQLKKLIVSKKAKELMSDAIQIIEDHPYSLPAILKKELISRNTDLLLVVLVNIHRANRKISKEDQKSIRRSFLHSTLFSKSKEKRKFVPNFYTSLKDKNWKDWGTAWDNVANKNIALIPPLPLPENFENMLVAVRKEYLKDRESWILDSEMLKKVLRENEEITKSLISIKEIDDDLSEDIRKEQEVNKAAENWKNISQYTFWNKQLLIISQREYFNREFEDFMAFDGIEDTNRPWDWDHIYPNDWVYRKEGISILVKWLKDSNGNFRALSFNENRSESNSFSPEKRFKDQEKTQKDSFIQPSDFCYWKKLTNKDKRLKDENPKVDDFVNAVLKRINNIYQDNYAVIYESARS